MLEPMAGPDRGPVRRKCGQVRCGAYAALQQVCSSLLP